LTRKTALELRKDDHRPLTEPSKTSSTFAPHAASCEVGVAEQSWTPDILTAKDLLIPQLESKYATAVDDSLQRKKKGEGKIGGVLSPLMLRGAETRVRRPLKTTLPSEMEFSRKRQIKTLGEKLDEINQLREEIYTEKLRQQESQQQLQKDVRRIAVSNNMGEGYPSTISMSASAPALKLLPQLAKADSTLSLVSNGSSVNSESRSFHNHGSSKRSSVQKKTTSIKNSTTPSKKGSEASVQFLDVNTPIADNTNTSEKLHSEQQELEFQMQKVQEIELIEVDVRRKYDHVLSDQQRMIQLKSHERSKNGRERSREIERRRRLLTEDEGRRRGPPQEDLPNIYDYYAIRIQTVIRGFLARAWSRWYKRLAGSAISIIQVSSMSFLQIIFPVF